MAFAKILNSEETKSSSRANELRREVKLCVSVCGRESRKRERGGGEKDATRKGARDETLILSFVNFPYA